MKKPYVVAVYDCASEFLIQEYAEFEEARLAYQGARAAYPKKVVVVSNLNRADYDSNGLDPAESEALECC